jgi:hypothetical protein
MIDLNEEIRKIDEEIEWMRDYNADSYTVEVKEGQYNDCLMVAMDVQWYQRAARITLRLKNRRNNLERKRKREALK